MVRRVIAAIGVTLVVMYVATFVVYGSLSAWLGLAPPAGASPSEFLLSVLVVKLGLAGGFVLLFHVARETWAPRWKQYALVWWVTFAVSEIGQALGPGYTGLEAVGGLISEAVYCPLAAWATARILRTAPPRGEGCASAG